MPVAGPCPDPLNVEKFNRFENNLVGRWGKMDLFDEGVIRSRGMIERDKEAREVKEQYGEAFGVAWQS